MSSLGRGSVSVLKWRGAARPCLCLQLLSKMLRGINISRRANVQAECVCLFVCLTQKEAVLRILPLFVQEEAARATGQTGSFAPLLEPDVFVGVKKQRKIRLSLIITPSHRYVHSLQ